MTQYINKDALEAEIDKLDNQDFSVIDDLNGRTAYLQAIGDFYKALDNLEVKEVDLEKEIQAFSKMELEPIKIYDANVGLTITMHQLYQCAKHFFELGIKMKQEGE